ncbi:MAG: hypothetical protein FWH55_07235 [Oscillospiraceae bacterium]|nr:hypothetical protein [Oscillospiraceae bacterium]
MVWIRVNTALALVLVCTVAIVFVVKTNPFSIGSPNMRIFEDQQTPLSAPPTPDESAEPYIEEEDEENHPLYIRPDSGTVTIPANSDILHMVLINPDENDCWFVFDIFLKDTGEQLYKSGLVAPGMCIEDFRISQTFSKGKYDAVLKIHAYEFDSYASISGASVDFSIIAD